MPDIKHIIHDEIRRLARKELKQDFEAVQKQVMEQKKAINALTKQIAALEKELAKAPKGNIQAGNENAAGDTGTTTVATEKAPKGAKGGKRVRKIKFKPSFMKKFRQKTGLSQSDIAVLLGCTTFTISHWETGKNIPNKTKFAELTKYFNAGKKELYAALLEKGIDRKAEISAEKAKKKLASKANMPGRKRLKKVVEAEKAEAPTAEQAPVTPAE